MTLREVALQPTWLMCCRHGELMETWGARPAGNRSSGGHHRRQEVPGGTLSSVSEECGPACTSLQNHRGQPCCSSHPVGDTLL